MQRLILSSALLFSLLTTGRAQSPLTHQRLFDTIPYIMDHHNNRLALFAQEPQTTGGTLFLGNSITEGGPWPELLKEETIVNRGISGDITFGVLKRLDEIIERKPDKLFMLIGINDLSMDIPPPVVADNVRKILERLKAESPGTELFLQSILPLNEELDGFLQHFGKSEQVLVCNQLLYKVAAEAQVTFVNLYPYFLDDRQRLKEELTYDGIHLTRAGYEHWATHLQSLGYLEK